MSAEIIDAGQSSAGWHRLELFVTCPRKFGYREVLGLVPQVESSPLALGSAVHAGLAAHYLQRSYEEGLANPSAGWAYKVPIARVILKAYVGHYLREPFQVLDVEREFVVNVNGRKFTRRIDLTFLQQGKVYALDHKTAGQPSKRFHTTQYEPALFTQELLGQATFESIYKYPYGGMVLNVIGNSEPVAFIRRPIQFPPRLLQQAPASLDYWISTSEKMLNDPELSPWTFPQSWACQGRYDECEYWALCKYGKSAEHGYRYREAR